jgi:hypothetical protein
VKNAIELIEAILTKDPPPPSAEGPLAAGLFQVVTRMLEKDPARRPGGMREVLHDLESLRAGNAPTLAPGRDHTVAVMGFANVTGRPEDAWLGTGLAETVSAGLAGVPGLAVVSRERSSPIPARYPSIVSSNRVRKIPSLLPKWW